MKAKDAFVKCLKGAWKYIKNMDSEQRRDAMALVVLGFCLLLISRGINSTVSVVTSAIVGYYFGRRNANAK